MTGEGERRAKTSLSLSESRFFSGGICKVTEHRIPLNRSEISKATSVFVEFLDTDG